MAELSENQPERALAGAAPSPCSDNADFIWTSSPEPHAERRRQLLQKYPQIKQLYGPCWRTKYVCTALIAAQVGAAYLLRDAPWWLIVSVAYLVGGVINQALLLAIHELSHNLAFKKPLHNRLFAFFINLPVGVPVAATFRYYHLLHHTRQGEAVDTDLPTAFEGRLLRSRPAKFVWILFQGFAYALRPLFVLPKKPDAWEIANFVLQLSFNAAIYYLWGLKALLYLPISALLVMGLHPVAGHYISEHYVMKGGGDDGRQETYSYYGPLNWLTFNVGYHNEHHDFPYIPGSRLPQLRRMAPEYYDTLVYHTSWTKTLWDYIMSPNVGAFSRVKRLAKEQHQLD